VSLIGGVLLRVISLDSTEKWIFASIAIGNCKAFLWSNSRKCVIDISMDNHIDDITYIGFGPPGVCENLHIYVNEIDDKEDIIFLMSPLVYENCDPFYLGIKPRDLGYSQKKKLV